jgi:hypothetical protein
MCMCMLQVDGMCIEAAGACLAIQSRWVFWVK